MQENWKQYSRGFLRDWAEGERDDDPTKSYPFPVPPVRDLTSNVNSVQTDEKSTLAVNPADQHQQTTDESSTVSSHSNGASNASVRPSLWKLAKVLVAKPPIATSNEVKDARFKLQGSKMLSSSVSIVICLWSNFEICIRM